MGPKIVPGDRRGRASPVVPGDGNRGRPADRGRFPLEAVSKYPWGQRSRIHRRYSFHYRCENERKPLPEGNFLRAIDGDGALPDQRRPALFFPGGPGVVPGLFELRRRREGRRSAGRTRPRPIRGRPERDRDYGTERVLTGSFTPFRRQSPADALNPRTNTGPRTRQTP